MNTIALNSDELALVQQILRHYPNTVLFGSRVKGTHKPFSDLDICLKDPISDYDYELLKEAFEESDLPFTVDLVEYNRCDESFKKIIDKNSITLSTLK